MKKRFVSISLMLVFLIGCGSTVKNGEDQVTQVPQIVQTPPPTFENEAEQLRLEGLNCFRESKAELGSAKMQLAWLRFEQQGNYFDGALTLWMLGGKERELGEKDSALKNWEMALNSLDKIQNPKNQIKLKAEIMEDMAEIYTEKGQKIKAAKYIAEVEDIKRLYREDDAMNPKWGIVRNGRIWNMR